MTNKPVHEPWQEKEKITLLAMVGDVPIFLITERYNIWAKMSKLPRRTEAEIKQFIFANAKNTEACGEYYAFSYLQKVLKISRRTRTRWAQQQKFVIASKPGYKKYVLRESVIEFARANPSLFCGLTKIELLSLLDEPTAEYIESTVASTYIRGRSVKVKCLETRIIYPSITKAALATYQGYHSISRSIAMNKKCLSGFHWRRV